MVKKDKCTGCERIVQTYCGDRINYTYDKKWNLFCSNSCLNKFHEPKPKLTPELIENILLECAEGGRDEAPLLYPYELKDVSVKIFDLVQKLDQETKELIVKQTN